MGWLRRRKGCKRCNHLTDEELTLGTMVVHADGADGYVFSIIAPPKAAWLTPADKQMWEYKARVARLGINLLALHYSHDETVSPWRVLHNLGGREALDITDDLGINPYAPVSPKEVCDAFMDLLNRAEGALLLPVRSRFEDLRKTWMGDIVDRFCPELDDPLRFPKVTPLDPSDSLWASEDQIESSSSPST